MVKSELETWEKREEMRIQKLAKKKWLKERDHNSMFSHVVINARPNMALISTMRLEDGLVLTSSPKGI